MLLMRKLIVPGLSVSAGPAARGAEDPGMEGGYRRQQPGNRKENLKEAEALSEGMIRLKRVRRRQQVAAS